MSASPAAGSVTTASVSHTMSMLTPEQILSRNPHSALRLPGATYGSLSKSHNSLTVPPNLSWVHAHLVSAANPNRDEGAADSLAEAVGGNERSKAYEYCVLVGNVLRSYDSFAAFWRGDHPTSEVRIVGASAWNPPPSARKGSLRSASVTKGGGVGSGMASWFGAARSPSASSVQLASPSPPSVAGATLAPTLASPPMMSATMKIATDGLTTSASIGEDNAPLGTAITSTLASEAAATSGYASPTAASSAASVDNADNAVNNNNGSNMSGSWQSVPSPSAVATPTASAPPQTSTFRIVTYAGTHIYCSAPTPADRDVWLASLHAGLESSMMSVAEVLNEVVEQAEVEAVIGIGIGIGIDIDIAIAAEPTAQTKKIREPNLSVPEQTILTPPLVQKRGIGSALRRKLLEAQQKGQPAPDQSELLSKQSDANISSFGYAAPFESLSPPANKHCISCGRYPPQTAYRPQSCPLSQYGMETRVDVCAECLISQGLLGHVKSYTGMYSADALERSALVKGRELVQNCIQATLAKEDTDRKERERKLEREFREKSERELEELVKEAGAICVHDGDAEDIEAKIDTNAEQNETEDEDVLAARAAMAEAEAVFGGSDEDDAGDEGENDDNENDNDNVNEEGDSNSSNETGDGTAGSSSWTAVNSHATSESTDKSNALSGSWADVPKEDSSGSAAAGTNTSSVDESVLLQGHTGRTLDSWVSLPPLPSTTVALLELVGSPNFQTLRRRSRVLDQNCRRLEGGVYGGTDAAAEFLETLEEHAREASVCASGVSGVSASAIELKKQALALSADLGSAIRLLKESAMGQKGPASTETLASILEYLLDVVEEGDLASVGFFWPQIRQIHLNMLPAVDVGSLVRIELVEDFLLTVAVKHSVHLALELVWGCIADLEESLGAPSESSPDCRRRRFAVLRFVCELESLIFDFDGGWGGGSVSLRSMLSPSQHQSDMIKDAFLLLQLHRRYGSHHLSRSVRLAKLKADSEDEEEDGADGAEIVADEDEDAGLERLRMVQHADYWTTQILFCRKLGDTAERMRFTPKEERRAKLESELSTLNASGKLGGDPLNRLAAEGDLIHVVNVPATEGHVFNSKARTPILMLMELIREESNISRAAIRRSRTPSKKEEALDEGIVGVQMMDTRDALEIDTGAYEDDADDARSVDESDIYKSAIDEGADVPPSPLATPKKPMVLGASVLGSAEGTRSRLNTEDSAHGSDSSVSSEKESMGSLVESMLGTKQFELPDLGDSSAKIEGEDAAEKSGGEGAQEDDNDDSDDIVAETGPKTTSDDATDDEDAEQVDSEPPTKPESSSPASPCNTPEEPSSPTSPSSSRPIPRSRSGSNIISARKGGLIESDNDDIGAFSQHGEGRRAVLEAIFLKGSKSSNPVAAAVAPGAQRAYQAMDRQRAFALINQTTKATDDASSGIDDDTAATTAATDQSPPIVEAAAANTTEDDDLIAALRLLLLQNRASTTLSGASFLAASDDNISGGGPEKPPGDPVDAGEIDYRLAGCGVLAPTVANALKMWKEGVITNEELISLVQKDNQFLEHSADPDNESKLMEDSNFWGRFAFGERWAEKKARIQTSSQHGSVTGWDLSGVIVKSNDDLRQEAFVMQLIELCREAFESAGLELWVHPYRILATGRTTGIIEMVRNAMSFDALKKRPGYDSGGLRGHLERMSEFTADAAAAFETAQKNFICSLASYSLMSYLFLFKDRHNGNLLLDTGGHVIHIDFGFVFGIAPGGSFSLEQSTPFKLTEEMLEVMGGTKSSLFSEFVTLFCCGFLALQAHAETFITLIEITAEGSSFPCFEGRTPDRVIAEMRERFCIGLDREATVMHALEIIRLAVTSYGTKQYDMYQQYSQGIAS